MIILSNEKIKVLDSLNIYLCGIRNDEKDELVHIEHILLNDDEQLTPDKICQLVEANFCVHEVYWTFKLNKDRNYITIIKNKDEIKSPIITFKDVNIRNLHDWFWVQYAMCNS